MKMRETMRTAVLYRRRSRRWNFVKASLVGVVLLSLCRRCRSVREADRKTLSQERRNLQRTIKRSEKGLSLGNAEWHSNGGEIDKRPDSRRVHMERHTEGESPVMVLASGNAILASVETTTSEGDVASTESTDVGPTEALEPESGETTQSAPIVILNPSSSVSEEAPKTEVEAPSDTVVVVTSHDENGEQPSAGEEVAEGAGSSTSSEDHLIAAQDEAASQNEAATGDAVQVILPGWHRTSDSAVATEDTAAVGDESASEAKTSEVLPDSEPSTTSRGPEPAQAIASAVDTLASSVIDPAVLNPQSAADSGVATGANGVEPATSENFDFEATSSVGDPEAVHPQVIHSSGLEDSEASSYSEATAGETALEPSERGGYAEGIRYDTMPRLPKGGKGNSAKGPKKSQHPFECVYEVNYSNRGAKNNKKKCRGRKSKKSKLHQHPLRMPGRPTPAPASRMPTVSSPSVAAPPAAVLPVPPVGIPVLPILPVPAPPSTSTEQDTSSPVAVEDSPTATPAEDTSSPTQMIVQAELQELWVYADPVTVETVGPYDISSAKQVFFDSIMKVMESYLASYLDQFLTEFKLTLTFLDTRTEVVEVGVTGSSALVKSFFSVAVDFHVASRDPDLLVAFTKARATGMVEAFFRGVAREMLLDELDEIGISVDVMRVAPPGLSDGSEREGLDEDPSPSPGPTGQSIQNPQGDVPEPTGNGDVQGSGGNPNTALYAGVVSAGVVLIAIVAVVYSTRRRKRRWFQDAVESVASSLHSEGAGPPDGKVLPVLTPAGTSTIRTGLLSSSPQSSQASLQRKSRVKPAAITMRGKNALRSQGSVSTLGSFNMTLNPVIEKESIEEESDSDRENEEVDSSDLMLMEDGPDLVAGTSLTCLDNNYSFEGLTNNYPEFELYSGGGINPTWSVDGLTVEGEESDRTPQSDRRGRWQDESSETELSRLPDHNSDLGYYDGSASTGSSGRGQIN